MFSPSAHAQRASNVYVPSIAIVTVISLNVGTDLAVSVSEMGPDAAGMHERTLPIFSKINYYIINHVQNPKGINVQIFGFIVFVD
jgi:hypothetical protein